MAGDVVEFTDAGFQSDVLNSDQPVLVDFWAPWCGPCKLLGPTIEQLATTYSGRVRVGKVNIDENQQAATDYAVGAIPTVIIFKGGQVVDRITGVPKISRFTSAIDPLL